MKEKEAIVISLGGSLIVPDEIDVSFLREFKQLLRRQIEKSDRRFFIITGGGKVCRRYQSALRELRPGVGESEVDWLGIHTTHLNAHFVHSALGDIADKVLLLSREDLKNTFEKPVVVGAGWEPGSSSDFDAVEVATAVDSNLVINLSNITHAYDKDPHVHEDAQQLGRVLWEEYRNFIPKDWDPGLSTPFDPVASEAAEKAGISVLIMGSDIENLERYLDTGFFEGTYIHPAS